METYPTFLAVRWAIECLWSYIFETATLTKVNSLLTNVSMSLFCCNICCCCIYNDWRIADCTSNGDGLMLGHVWSRVNTSWPNKGAGRFTFADRLARSSLDDVEASANTMLTRSPVFMCSGRSRAFSCQTWHFLKTKRPPHPWASNVTDIAVAIVGCVKICSDAVHNNTEQIWWRLPLVTSFLFPSFSVSDECFWNALE